ncbi:MAG: 50S ribosomal protein L6 [Cyanobacteria bacterium P01_H01_bin.15]
MSRIGKQPINLPPKVSVKVNEQTVSVSGPKGTLEREIPSLISVEQHDNQVSVKRINESRNARQLHGLCRTLVANMVEGVAKGYEKKLLIQGVGYRAQVQGNKLTLNVGFSHPVEIQMPQGVQATVEKNTSLTVNGIDKEVVGNICAKIRDVRPPEPYKGKGIRYADEYVRRKAGKTGKK